MLNINQIGKRSKHLLSKRCNVAGLDNLLLGWLAAAALFNHSTPELRSTRQRGNASTGHTALLTCCAAPGILDTDSTYCTMQRAQQGRQCALCCWA